MLDVFSFNVYNYDMRKALFTKFSAIFILLTLLSAPLFAVDLNAFVELAQSGNISDIDTAFRQTPELKNQTFGDNKETFLIIAIKNNRPIDIIELLVKFGCKVKAKSKDKRTTVMYAAKFNSDPDVLRLLIKECAITKSGRRNFINEADENGFTAFDYAKENPNSATILSVLRDYEDMRDVEKEEKARAKEEKKAEKARQKEEEKAAKEAEKAAKEEEKQRLKEEEKAKKEAEKAAKEEEKAAKEEEKQRQKEEAKAAKEAEKAAKEEEKAAKEEEKQRQKEEAKAAKEAEKTAKEEEKAEKSQPKEEQKQEPPAETKPAKQQQKPQTQYKDDDFFKNSYNEADFVASQEEAEAAPQQPAANRQKEQQKKAEPKQQQAPVQQQTEAKDRLQMKEEIKPQPYTKSYLFDYITDTTPESPVESTSKTASVTIENVDRQDRNGITLLMKAAKAGNDWDVQNLLANGANVQLRDKEGWSALMYAVRYQNNLSIVTKLIESGAHVRVRNKVNTTPLLIAANYTQNPEILKLLLKDRTASEDEVYAAFILALTSEEGAEHVKVSKIKIFLEMGISVNRMWKGKTPLMYACQYGNSTEVLKLLMEAGARTSIQNQDGKTAFDYAGQNSALPHDDIYWSINSIGR